MVGGWELQSQMLQELQDSQNTECNYYSKVMPNIAIILHAIQNTNARQNNNRPGRIGGQDAIINQQRIR
jgi:hypothetical protein